MPDPQTTTVTVDDHGPANLQVLGVARSQAHAVAYQSLAQSLSLLMQNSVAAQQAAATLNTAIVTLSVKRLTGGVASVQDSSNPETGNA